MGGRDSDRIITITSLVVIAHLYYWPSSSSFYLLCLSTQQEGGPPYKVSLESVKSLLEAEGFICQKLELLPPELCHKGRDGSGNWNAASGIGHWTLP